MQLSNFNCVEEDCDSTGVTIRLGLVFGVSPLIFIFLIGTLTVVSPLVTVVDLFIMIVGLLIAIVGLLVAVADLVYVLLGNRNDNVTIYGICIEAIICIICRLMNQLQILVVRFALFIAIRFPCIIRTATGTIVDERQFLRKEQLKS